MDSRRNRPGKEEREDQKDFPRPRPGCMIGDGDHKSGQLPFSEAGHARSPRACHQRI